MKKTLRTILAGAVALLAVSCYDDSDLRGQIGEIDERLKAVEATLNAEVGGINDLATRLAAAEGAITTLEGNVTTFTTQIAGIITRLDAIDGAADGKIKNLEDAIAALKEADKTFASKAELAEAAAKIAVVSVAEENGNVVLTLADGSKVSLSKPLENVENSGLVTVVEDEAGNKYWAVVEADGTKKSLEVPVGHPDITIEFSVAENGDLMYAVNGAEPVQTGVNTSSLSGCHLNGVKVSDNGKYVTVSIDGVDYVLPVYNPVPTVQIKSGKQYFAYAASKTVEVGLEGVSSLVVMNQPYGWKASVKGSKLTVTAPSETNADAEKEGVVVLHGDANGLCMTASLNVAVGAGFELTVSPQGEISVVNPLVATSGNEWIGYETNFANAACGVVSVDTYNQFGSFAEFFEAVQYDEEGLYGVSGYLENIKNNLELGSYYDEEGGYVVDTYTVSVEKFAGAFWPALELVKGEKYVIWAVPQTTEVLMDDYVLAFYEPVIVELNEKISFNEISLTLGVYGAEEAYLGVISAAQLETYGMSFDEYMQMNRGMGAQGPWAQMQQWGMDAIGPLYGNGESVSVAELNRGALSPDTKYHVWAMPNKGLAPSECNYETDFKPYVFELTTSGVTAGGTAAELSLNDATNYTSISVDVTLPESTTAYYYFYGVGATDNFETELDLVKDVLDNGTEMTESGIAKKSYLNAGATQILVVLTLTADGQYALAQESFSTLSYPIVETITTAVESVTKTESGYSAVINVTGATKVAVYTSSQASYSNFNNYLMNKNTYFKYADVVEGKATVAFTASNDNYYMLVAGFNENEDGSVKEISAYVADKIADKLQ